MQSIDIKTEPAGYISFGQLTQEQVAILRHSLEAQEIADELLEIRYNSDGSLEECEGVFISGAEGERGNEGIIAADEYTPSIGPARSEEGVFNDGVYVINMQLSKCSIGFEFDPDGEYDPRLLEEVSTGIEVPVEIEHGSYGHPDYRVVTGYRYNGEDIEEAGDAELIDRGFTPHLIFFVIKNGETTVIYSNYNGEEEWASPETSASLLSGVS
jgi:hypothetical protein